MSIENMIKNVNLDDDKYIVVGVSTGPDSMALLHMLKEYLSINIVCAHINHNIRLESNEEEQYLKEYCLKNNIIFESMKIKGYQQNNFENEAREKRYAFYESILKKYHAHKLFLAHHGDDLIETILMKIYRGSNIEGYAGIKTISYNKDYQIIRPLLCLTKEDIIKYNQEHKIKFYIDKSNNNTLYTRNRFRKNILPVLKSEDKNVHLKFLNYSNTLTEYDEYINYEVAKKISKMYKDNYINLEIFNQEHPFMKKNIIYGILKSIYNNEANIIKDKNVNDILKMSNSHRPNYSICLPKNYIAKKSYNYIYIGKHNKNDIPFYKYELQEHNQINGIIIDLIDNIETNGNDVCRLNSKNIMLPLYLRNKKNGDFIETLGLNGKQKVKDIFIDKKLLKDIRDGYPLLVDSQDNILWIPGIKKSKYNSQKNDLYDIILNSHMESEEKNEEESK